MVSESPTTCSERLMQIRGVRRLYDRLVSGKGSSPRIKVSLETATLRPCLGEEYRASAIDATLSGSVDRLYFNSPAGLNRRPRNRQRAIRQKEVHFVVTFVFIRGLHLNARPDL